jgi:glycosyltransferase involved in cell wall biosynthesis
MLRVSVIIPVYNSQEYLAECLDTLLSQTMQDIEVLCVDDGSTDGSADILAEYSARDARVRVFAQPNAGAGAARNRALGEATGEFLFFADADDFFEMTMLEDAYRACTRDDADVGVFRVRYHETDTGKVRPADELLKMDLVPERMPFSRAEMPDHILEFTAPAPWNKLFRRAFVEAHGLRFQEIRRANDLLFTKLALAKAERITVIDKALVNYRVGSGSNLQALNDGAPSEFYSALIALRDELARCDLLPELDRAFVNMSLATCLYNLHSLKTLEAYHLVYAKLRDEWFGELGLDDHDAEDFLHDHQYAQYMRIRESDSEQYLLDEVRYLRDLYLRRRASLRKAREALARTRDSRAFRIGRWITTLPRTLRRAAGG